MHKKNLALAVLASSTLLLAACATPSGDATPSSGSSAASSAAEATATLHKADGSPVGTATFSQADGGTTVSLKVERMKQGFYGFHIHATGQCAPDSTAAAKPEKKGDFLSAGGHLGSDTTQHPNHAGDLPSLLVNDDGTEALRFTTDRLTPTDLNDADGSAAMLHAGPDNFANIPRRYAPDGADKETLGAGDAGTRLACGVIK